MAPNVFAATQRERCTLLPGMGSHTDFTSLEALIFSLPFKAVSFIVCCVFVRKSESCYTDAETLTPSYGWRKPQAAYSALGSAERQVWASSHSFQ